MLSVEGARTREFCRLIGTPKLRDTAQGDNHGRSRGESPCKGSKVDGAREVTRRPAATGRRPGGG